MAMAETLATLGEVTDYPYAGLFRRILLYYGLDYSPAICFGLGCELDFALPAPAVLGLPRGPGFHGDRFHHDLNYAIGMWFREVQSHTNPTFLHYLHLEWEDFAGKMQPLPILTHLPGPAVGTLRPVLLVDLDPVRDLYTFLCGLTGEWLVLGKAELQVFALSEYGHAIFHPPLNFLKHAQKFRPLRSSVAYALRTTAHQLTVGFPGETETGLPALRRLADRLGGDDLDLVGLARYYLAVARDDQGQNGLYRRQFAAFLAEAAPLLNGPELARAERAYRELATQWGAFLDLCKALRSQAMTAEAFRLAAQPQLEALSEGELRAADLLRAGLVRAAEGGWA